MFPVVFGVKVFDIIDAEAGAVSPRAGRGCYTTVGLRACERRGGHFAALSGSAKQR